MEAASGGFSSMLNSRCCCYRVLIMVSGIMEDILEYNEQGEHNYQNNPLLFNIFHPVDHRLCWILFLSVNIIKW